MTYIAKKFIISIYLIVVCSVLKAQPDYIMVLEQDIYHLNNAFNYTESQKKLQSFIERPDATNTDKYYAYLFLSYTYKRLFDYTSAEKYLDKALEYGQKTATPQYFIANIHCQKALIYFDIQQYNTADSIMKILAAKNYEHLNSEYQSKIIMQEAYLLYLKKEYLLAEKKYDKAIELLRLSSPCDLPMIYTKKIDLYDKMLLNDKTQEAYKASMFYADSCDILKYKIYTKETYINNIIAKNGTAKLMAEADSLNRIYKHNEHLKELQDLEKKYELNLKNTEIKNKEKRIFLLALLAFVLFFILLASIYFLWFIRKQKNLIAKQNNFNENLISIISHDIKEPLMGVNLLLKKLKIKDELLNQATSSLEQQIASVNTLLTTLLQLKKLNGITHKAPLTPVLPLIKQIMDEEKEAIDKKNLTFDNTITDDIHLPIEPEKLYIILRNLTTNAIKFSFPDSIIHIKAIDNGISIKDFGVGIPTEKQSQLLYQAVKSELGTQQETGNGLGLYLIKHLIAESNLKMSFHSILGEGTEVRLFKSSFS